MSSRIFGFAMIAVLYVTQGVPLGLAMEALPSLLRQGGVPLDVLAFLPLVGLPWVVKVLWAPLVDNHWLPRWGRRRSWILPMQGVVLCCLLAVMGLGISPETIGWVVALFALSSLACASQDTATDGMAAEWFTGRDLAIANGIQVAGTMIGFFCGGSGTLILAGLFGTPVALGVLAAVVAFGMGLAVLWAEPAAPERAAAHDATLLGFLRRPGAWPLLGLALLSAVTASAGFGLWKLFLIDQGWTLDAVGRLGMSAGVVTIVLGCGGGVWLVTRVGVWRTLGLGLSASLLAAAAWLAVAQGFLPDLGGAMGAAALGAVGAGATSVAAMALAMTFAAASPQAGTDMTAVQSTRDLGEIGTSGMLTGLAAAAGYGGAFGVVVGVSVVAMGTVFMAWRASSLRGLARELVS